ncbi:MAG: lactate utilization protein [Candidatus Eiseniibacteriota bacterium]|nr:MAG: lactate utilization protein [Candidatus Eisenbacteria bacterium]
MEDVYSSYIKNLIDRTTASLQRCGFEAFAVATRAEAKEKTLGLIPPGSSVGIGGSVTLKEIGVIEALVARGDTVYAKSSASPDFDYRKAQLTSDVFLSSTNAITVDGDLVNVDGTGNRVAAMAFGPGKVIVVTGWNKIVSDVGAAFQRIRDVAAPLNDKRLELDVPCAETGFCVDCDAPDNICRITTIISRKPKRADFTVILVAEQLGY